VNAPEKVVPIEPAPVEEVSLYEIRKKIHPRAVTGWFATLRWAAVAFTDHLLRPAVAHVERPAGGAAGHRRAQVLHRRPRVLAAGRDLPHRPAADRRVLAVPVHHGRGPAVVRLRLPADGLHRDVPVGGAQGRGRAGGSHPSRCRAALGRQVPEEGDQARDLDRDRAVDRHHLRRLLHADPRAGAQHPVQPRRVGDVLDPVLRPRDLRQCGLDARAGVQVHVPVRPLPVGDVRQGHADHRLRHGSRRAARRAQEEGRPARTGARRLRGLRDLRAGVPDRDRHPQGPAVRVHRLRGLRRRLRPGDGQDGLPEGAHPLRVRARPRAALRPQRRCCGG